MCGGEGGGHLGRLEAWGARDMKANHRTVKGEGILIVPGSSTRCEGCCTYFTVTVTKLHANNLRGPSSCVVLSSKVVTQLNTCL